MARTALALGLFALTASVSVAAPPVIAKPGDIRGLSWSDPRDNYNPGRIVPAGLKPTDSAARAAEVADAVARRAISVDANVIRLGINPPTVADPQWWAVYQSAVRTIGARGVSVILCAWEQSPDVAANGRDAHDGRFGAGTVQTYAAMWKTVQDTFRDDACVIGYELLNEPFGYVDKPDDYIRDMRTLMTAVGDDLRGKHFIVAGLGYSDDVRTVAAKFPEPQVWLAFHVYPNWFGGEAGETILSRQTYADEIATRLAGVETRTVITEFGCWGGKDFDYSRSADEQATPTVKRHVAYLQGVADACVRLNLGSVYWFADARETRRRPAYDLFAADGRPLDPDKVDEVRRAWRLEPR